MVQERRRKPVCVTATTSALVTRTNHATVRFVTNQLGHALGFRAFYRAGQAVCRFSEATVSAPFEPSTS